MNKQHYDRPPPEREFLDCDVYGEGGILKLRMLFD
jgi:hypothetical protein